VGPARQDEREHRHVDGYASDDTFVEYLSSSESERSPSPPLFRRLCSPSMWRQEREREGRWEGKCRDARDFLVLCVLLLLLLDMLLRERKLLWYSAEDPQSGAPDAGEEEGRNATA
jgi:hypothetical protein